MSASRSLEKIFSPLGDDLPLYLARAKATLRLIQIRDIPQHDSIVFPDLSDVLMDIVHYINHHPDIRKDDLGAIEFLLEVLVTYFNAGCPIRYLCAPLSVNDTHTFLNALSKLSVDELKKILNKIGELPSVSMLDVSFTRSRAVITRMDAHWQKFNGRYHYAPGEAFANLVKINVFSNPPTFEPSRKWDESTQFLRTLIQSARYLSDSRHYDRSIDLLTDLIQFRRYYPQWGAYGEDHIKLEYTYRSRARAYRKRGNPRDYNLAILDYEQVLALAVFDKHVIIFYIAGCYFKKGEAVLALQKFLDVFLKEKDVLTKFHYVNRKYLIDQLSILDILNLLSQFIEEGATPLDLSQIQRRDIRALIGMMEDIDDQIRLLESCCDPRTHLGNRFADQAILETDATEDVETELKRLKQVKKAILTKPAGKFRLWNTNPEDIKPEDDAPLKISWTAVGFRYSDSGL